MESEQKKRLADSKNKEIHQFRLKECQSKRLKDLSLRNKHLKQLKISQHQRICVQAYHKKQNDLAKQNYNNKVTREQDGFRLKLFRKYNDSIKDGPYWECVSCCRLLFRSSVNLCSVQMFEKVPPSFIRECCSKMIDDTNVGYLCSACKKSLSRNKKPRFSMCHEGLKFPRVSEEVKKLTPLEERFLCPFMQIRTFAGNQQYSVKGRVVNVPTDVA